MMTQARTERQLDEIICLLKVIVAQEKYNMTTLNDILAEVQAETSIDNGLLTLINTLAANQNNPAVMDQILTTLKSNIAPLSAALTANTPAAPAPAANPATPAA